MLKCDFHKLMMIFFQAKVEPFLSNINDEIYMFISQTILLLPSILPTKVKIQLSSNFLNILLSDIKFASFVLQLFKFLS